MSSSNPSGTIKLGKALAERGIGFVDAPVSGGIARAVTGTLALMAGTDDPRDLARVTAGARGARRTDLPDRAARLGPRDEGAQQLRRRDDVRRRRPRRSRSGSTTA